ncbi:hypothetical protein HDU67_009634 [Dinochytrium kinnereticum]|nr:hypothetical protein HDU67_009634 [Dinochytrium kinnereticum]
MSPSASPRGPSSLSHFLLIALASVALVQNVNAHDGHDHSEEGHEHSSEVGTIIVEHKPNPSAASFRPSDFVADLFAEYGSGVGSSRVLSLDSLVEIYQAMSIIGGASAGGDPHEGHDHGSALVRRQAAPAEFDPCLLPYDLLSIYGLNATAGVNRTQFERITPGLVYISSAKLCKDKVFQTSEVAKGPSSNKPVVGFVWLYSFVAITLVTITCMFGMVFVPLFKSSPFLCDLLLSFLIALGAGTLLADSFLHLIPQILKLHVHGPEDEHNHSSGNVDLIKEFAYVWTMSKVMLFIYLFWSAEQLLRYLHSTRVHHSPSHQHGHSHSTMAHSHAANDSHSHLDTDDIESTHENGDKSGKEVVKGGKKTLWEEVQTVRPVAILILLGDTLHNFVDGLAIGASFSVSTKFGLTTSIAVLLHELPHELADYAILYSSGFSAVRAALLNMASNLSAFLGMAIGILVASNPSLAAAEETILSIAAGIFIYIALSDLIPELSNIHSVSDCHLSDTAAQKTSSVTLDGESKKSDGTAVDGFAEIHPYSWPRVVAQHCGWALGWLIMVLIALYGERIKV